MHRSGLFRRCSLTSEVPIRRGTTYVDSTRMGTFDGEVTEFVRNNAGLATPAIARRQVEEPAGSARRTAVPLRHTGFIAPSRQPPTTCVVMLDGPATSSQRRGSSVGSRCPQQGRRLSAARREAGASGGIVRHNASSVGTAPGPRQLTRNRPDVGQTRPAAVQPGLSGGHLTRSR